MNIGGKAELGKALRNKRKIVAMLAPSFVADFDYPGIIGRLRRLGFNRVVELTFGAKLVNREYHSILEKSDGLMISSVCPGIVENVKKEFPKYSKNLVPVISPMIATALISREIYPSHSICFISPCEFKKHEAKNSGCVDFVINYKELNEILPSNGKGKETFDKFYNEYTRIYPISGGLSKTAHIKGVLKPENAKVIDGIGDVDNFLKNPDKRVKFLDCTFCSGGCIGGPYTNQKISIKEKKDRVLKYLKSSERQKIPKGDRGVLIKSKGIKLRL